MGKAGLFSHPFGAECVCVLSLQSCPTLRNPVDCSPPGSSVHGILQAKVLEWVAICLSSHSAGICKKKKKKERKKEKKSLAL